MCGSPAGKWPSPLNSFVELNYREGESKGGEVKQYR